MLKKKNLVGKARFLFFSNDKTKGNFFTFWKWHNSIRFERILKNQLMNKIEIEQIEKIIGIKFNKKKILEQAFTHKSVSKAIEINNERLEFLGDRVLGLVIAGNLNKIYPTDSEGQLDKKLALLVNKSTCAKIIQDLKLNNFLNLSKSQKRTNLEMKKYSVIYAGLL